MFFKLAAGIMATAVVALKVNAETHTVTLSNNCDFGTPTLLSQSGQVLSTGSAYTTNGPAYGLIAFLQNGACGQNRANCTTVDVTLANGDSTAEVYYVVRETFDPCVSFNFYDGCDGVGEDCPNAPSPRTCSADNVNINITWCG